VRARLRLGRRECRAPARIVLHAVVDDELEASLVRDHLRRIAGDDRARRHGARDEGARRNDRVVADGDLADDDRLRADVYAVTDRRIASFTILGQGSDGDAVLDGDMRADRAVAEDDAAEARDV